MRVHFEQEKAAKEEEERQNSALRGALKASENKGKKLEEVHKIYIHVHIHYCRYLHILKVGERQKRRKIAQLQMFTESTLQPCMATYGLKPMSVMAVTDEGPLLLFLLPVAQVRPPACCSSSRSQSTCTLPTG